MKPEQGFTLIEVIVAAAVFAIAATALFGLFSKSLFNLRKIEDVHRYQLAGEEVLNRVLALPKLPAEAYVEGNVEGLDARWTVMVRPWIPGNLQSRTSEAIMKIDVEVQWPGRAGPRNIRLETVKPVPVSYENYNFTEAIEQVFPR